ncbi:FAD-dependent oxidoreductase [Rhodococcus qingshengii]|nr:FAD-dependent oxidoreductase [Rhodococcus qingshengii]MDJ0439737.1 FAD-dependent oxidoreductase [Rhodococcus qingshengii]
MSTESSDWWSTPSRGCPASIPPVSSRFTCLYTSTPDSNFVIDRVGAVTVAAGFSGHGFKFGPALGELVADLVDGTTLAPEVFRLGER